MYVPKWQVLFRNNLRNGAFFLNEKVANVFIHAWHAHKTEVARSEYLEKVNTLLSCGVDGSVRCVLLV